MNLDYSSLTPELIEQKTDTALAAADKIVDQVVSKQDDDLTFSHVLAPLDQIISDLYMVYGEIGFMGNVHTKEEVRNAARKAGEKVSIWGTELPFREDLYRVITAYAQTDEAKSLAGERARLLEFTQRDLRRAGHQLSAEDRDEVKARTARLVQLATEFEQNIAEYSDHLTVPPDQTEGLPASYLEGLSQDDQGNYRVSMDYPDVVPFMKLAANRSLREQLSRKFNNRAVDENTPILEEAVKLRQEIAQIFSLPSWAHYQLEEKMAKTPEAVEIFYDQLLPALTTLGQREVERMTAMLEADGHTAPLQVWDWQYYDNQLRKTEYDVDIVEVSQYFSLERVIEGMLALTGKVFGISYEELPQTPAWHEDVKTYRISDTETGQTIAHCRMDLFPRPGKFTHAAAFPQILGRTLDDGSYQQPLATIVANFTKPTKDRPSLLTHEEVEPFFHEFGHILHQTLTRTELATFSGTNTEGDFVEAPSQIMEHWVWQPQILSRFARHYKTDQPIPTELVNNLTAARMLNKGVFTLRQASFGKFDMEIHGPQTDIDLEQSLRNATEISLFPFVEDTFFPASFGHLFGYDAGYYGYLWSVVYGDDMFTRFEQEGLDSEEVGADYRREVLARGGSRDAIEHLRAFLGREPNNAAFLRHLGLTSADLSG